MTTEQNTPTAMGKILTSELVGVRQDLTRVDGKTGTLLSLDTAVLAFILTQVNTKDPLAERALLGAAVLALTGSALILLLRVLLPRLAGGGFTRWSDSSGTDILRELVGVPEDEHLADDLAVLSTIAHRKFLALRSAVLLMAAGIVLLTAAILTGIMS